MKTDTILVVVAIAAAAGLVIAARRTAASSSSSSSIARYGGDPTRVFNAFRSDDPYRVAGYVGGSEGE